MTLDSPAEGPIQVLVALPHALDSEAYAARINQERGWEARTTPESGPWEIRLSDRCRLATPSLNGSAEQRPNVVLGGREKASLAHGNGNCTCCWWVPRGAVWPGLFRALSEAAGRRPGIGDLEGLEALTRRELDVLRLVGQGKSVPACAEVLGVSPSTVGNHKYRLMRKLRVKTSLELLRIAVRHGLATFD